MHYKLGAARMNPIYISDDSLKFYLDYESFLIERIFSPENILIDELTLLSGENLVCSVVQNRNVSPANFHIYCMSLDLFVNFHTFCGYAS